MTARNAQGKEVEQRRGGLGERDKEEKQQERKKESEKEEDKREEGKKTEKKREANQPGPGRFRAMYAREEIHKRVEALRS
jgi:hypothetical protein